MDLSANHSGLCWILLEHNKHSLAAVCLVHGWVQRDARVVCSRKVAELRGVDLGSVM